MNYKTQADYRKLNLIDKEELKKSIESCKCLGKIVPVDTILEVIDIIPVGFGWNSVLDSLPKQYDSKENSTGKFYKSSSRVLVAVLLDDNVSVVEVGKLKNDKWEFEKQKIYNITHSAKVTHWMYFPEPPKGGKIIE